MISVGKYQRRSAKKPSVVAVSPGRVNLIGEHIDYLGGCVMPIAIDRHLTVEASATADGFFEIVPQGDGLPGPVRFGGDGLSRRMESQDRWLNYIIGVIAGYRAAGVDVPGFRAVIHSDIPVGAGLSSSAALETAIALVIEALSGVERDVVDRALLCQRAEHEYAGVPCGIMDQLAVGGGRAGHVLHLDCRDLSMRHYPIPDGLVLLVADTGVKHALGDGEYRKRREDCDAAMAILGTDSFRDVSIETVERFQEPLGDRLFRRARHAVSEMTRVETFAVSLEERDLLTLGNAMRESHRSLRDDYEVSCPELDLLVDSAYAFGIGRGLVGSRMTGGGFGGSTISLVSSDSAGDLKIHLETAFWEAFGRKLDCFITSAVDGAKVVTVE